MINLLLQNNINPRTLKKMPSQGLPENVKNVNDEKILNDK